MIEAMDRPNHASCDDCGVLVPMGYCSAGVTEWIAGKEQMRTYCNRCRLFNTDPKIRDTSKRSTCKDCQLKGCQYWQEFHRAKEVVNEPVRTVPNHTGYVSPTINQLEHKPNQTERHGLL